MSGFSEYIIFADESGSPTLTGIDPDYPVFVLAFILIRKQAYSQEIVPAIQRLKFDFFGHDQIILHERDIRRQTGDFALFQSNPGARQAFLDRLTRLVAEAALHIVVAVIRKTALRDRYDDPWSPYDIALSLCMERAADFLRQMQQQSRTIHVLFEARGRTEDRQLELEFRRITNGQGRMRSQYSPLEAFGWIPLFVSKKSNASGLQLADLIARPAGLQILRPGQPNRSYDAFSQSLHHGRIECFP